MVKIATGYGLDGPGIKIPLEKKFSAPVQTGYGWHSAYYTMGTKLFRRVKRPGCGVDHPPLSSAEGKEIVEG